MGRFDAKIAPATAMSAPVKSQMGAGSDEEIRLATSPAMKGKSNHSAGAR